jgi:predicted aspartyl protease
MLCPKCGFSQMDDVYCANCGINIEAYLQKNKKRRYAEGFVILLLCVGALYLASYIHNVRSADTRAPERQTLHLAQEPDVRGQTEPEVKTYQVEPKSQSPSLLKDPARERAAGPPKTPIPPDAAKSKPASEEDIDVSAPQEGGQKERKAPAESGEAELTPEQWLEKGLLMDDDSEAEALCYKKALALAPKMASAHYRLGAIYFRQAEYDLADEEFLAFLKHATPEERQRYDIYVYYSLAEVEGLLQQKEAEGNDAEAGDTKGAQTDKKKGRKKRGRDKTSESEEELKAVVRFSKVRGHIKVPVLLNDQVRANMMLDTGAGITILSKDVATELGLQINPHDAIRLKTIAQDVQVPLTTLDSLVFGPLQKKHFPVGVSDLNLGDASFDGILGMDFLGNHPIVIDNEKMEIVLRSK